MTPLMARNNRSLRADECLFLVQRTSLQSPILTQSGSCAAEQGPSRLARDPLLFHGERTQTKPLVHVARQRPVADQLDGPRIDLSLQRRVPHPSRSHAAQRTADVQIDVISGIDAAKVDFPVFDHEPPVSAPAV